MVEHAPESVVRTEATETPVDVHRPADINLLAAHGVAGLSGGVGARICTTLSQFTDVRVPDGQRLAASLQKGATDVLATREAWRMSVTREFDGALVQTGRFETMLARQFGYKPTSMPSQGFPSGLDKQVHAPKIEWLNNANSSLRNEIPSLYVSPSAAGFGRAQEVSALFESNRRLLNDASHVAGGSAISDIVPPASVRNPLPRAVQLFNQAEQSLQPWLKHVWQTQVEATTNTYLWEKELQRRFGYTPTPAQSSYSLLRETHATRNDWLKMAANRQSEFLSEQGANLAKGEQGTFFAARMRLQELNKVTAVADSALAVEQTIDQMRRLETQYFVGSKPRSMSGVLAETALATGAVIGADLLVSTAADAAFGSDSVARRVVQPNIYGTLATTAALVGSRRWDTKIIGGAACWIGSKALNFALDEELRKKAF